MLLNINDWKIIQMRNDLKFIKRNAIRNNAANWSLVVELFLVLLAFVLDRSVADSQKVNTIWGVIAAGAIIIPLVLFMIESIKIKHAEEVSRRVLNTKELVEIFDDEICYMIMSAESFSKNLSFCSTVDSRQTALLLEFYTIEIGYYLNKAVRLLLKMDNNLTGVLDTKNLTHNHISKVRLINSIRLIVSIYQDLFEFSESKTDILKEYSVVLDPSDEKAHYQSLKDFVERKQHLLGIDIKTIFQTELLNFN